FRQGADIYDDKNVEYLYSFIDTSQLQLQVLEGPESVSFQDTPEILTEMTFPVSANQLMEYVSNYIYRKYWVKGVDKLEFNENEVTRLGSKHTCIIDGKDLNFTTITKDAKESEQVYGEVTKDAPFLDTLYQFFIVTAVSENESHLRSEIYWEVHSPVKRFFANVFAKRIFKRNNAKALQLLLQFVKKEAVTSS
ncbi:MAG: DUF2652 domain-containing protein, partial [Bacteroidota bacterium]